MRLAITLTRTGDTWKVKNLPSVPLGDQLAEFKAAKVAGDFGGADEVQVWSNGDILKRHTKKSVISIQPAPVATEAPEAEEPKEVKKGKK